MYLLPKFHERLVNLPGRPVLSNCDMLTEKASEFLDYHLPLIMMSYIRSGMSFIKDTNYFAPKLKNLNKIPDNAILNTADVVGLYPSIPLYEDLEVLKKQLDNFYEKSIPTEDLVKMAEVVLKNKYFVFNSNVKHQISGTVIGTKFAPPYACIHRDYMENQFLKNEQIQPWIWFRYIENILERLKNFHPNLKFTHERSREEISFFDVTVRVNHGEFITILYCKPTDIHHYLHFESCHPSHTKSSIILSQALRIRRISPKKSDLVGVLESLRTGSRKEAIQRIWSTRRQRGHLKVLH